MLWVYLRAVRLCEGRKERGGVTEGAVQGEWAGRQEGRGGWVGWCMFVCSFLSLFLHFFLSVVLSFSVRVLFVFWLWKLASCELLANYGQTSLQSTSNHGPYLRD